MPGQAVRQWGLVVGRRFAGVFLAAGLCDVEALALVLAPVPAFATAFLFVAGFLVVVAAAPDATRDECFTRCLVFFGVAASAIDDSANAATSAATSSFSALRAMGLP